MWKKINRLAQRRVFNVPNFVYIQDCMRSENKKILLRLRNIKILLRLQNIKILLRLWNIKILLRLQNIKILLRLRNIKILLRMAPGRSDFLKCREIFYQQIVFTTVTHPYAEVCLNMALIFRRYSIRKFEILTTLCL